MDDIVESFKAITGLTKNEEVHMWLVKGNYDIETSINIFLSSKIPTNFDSSSIEQEEYVRKAIPVKRLRLIDDNSSYQCKN